MEYRFEITSIEELDLVANKIIEISKKKRIFCFYGSMGSGKTTLIKSIGKILNTIQEVNSPTFAIVNEYETQSKELIYHFDLYRIEKVDELYDIGFEEYLESNRICLIEWPQISEDFLPLEKVSIYIENKSETREFLIIE